MRRLLVLVVVIASLLAPAPALGAQAPSCGPAARGGVPLGGQTNGGRASSQYVVQRGDTLGAIAARTGSTVAAIVQANRITNPNLIYPGQVLVIPGGGGSAAPLPAPFVAVWRAGPTIQGQAVPIWIQTAPGVEVTGRFEYETLRFQQQCGLLWGLVGLDALLDPGTYPLQLTATQPGGATVTANVYLDVVAGRYGTETVWLDPNTSKLLDPALIRAERQRLYDLTSPLGGPPLWSGPFRRPMDTVITSYFGTRRSYNGAPSTSYHEGIDFRGRIGDPIYAAAPGRVILAEPLTVRGGTVYLDHGAGVVTGYFHMSEFAVDPGQVVRQGELLGRVGATGLVTGSHLHWEMRVHGDWVDPTPWLSQVYP